MLLLKDALIYENDWNLKFFKKLCINSGAFFPMQAFFQMLKKSVPHKRWKANLSLAPENIGKWNKNSLCDFFVTLCISLYVSHNPVMVSLYIYMEGYYLIAISYTRFLLETSHYRLSPRSLLSFKLLFSISISIF